MDISFIYINRSKDPHDIYIIISLLGKNLLHMNPFLLSHKVPVHVSMEGKTILGYPIPTVEDGPAPSLT